MVPLKKNPRKNGPLEIKSSERSMEKGPRKNGPLKKKSLEKCFQKIFIRQNNTRKLEGLFYVYRLIPLHTQKDV